ncbi:MAG: transglutaminase-like domain-containing protein [Solirubrobacteraceae bacterium]
MSAGASTVTVPPRFARAPGRAGRELSSGARTGIRLAAFAALGFYGVLRWTRLTAEAPTGRLLGLLGLAVVLAGAVSVLRRFGRAPAIIAAVVLCLLALPVAGLPWPLVWHVKIAVSARDIGDGLAGLPNAVVPYTGASSWVRTVITLGAAVLLLDAAIVLAFAPEAFGDLRRAGAALPLIALAVVPATLVRPELPYAQGLVLFALLAAFMWAERLRRETAAAALVLALLAGVVGVAAAPRLDQHRALLAYRAWAGGLVHQHVDAFVWNETYGPLHWPRQGHVVMTVDAKTRDYWKAENLDIFNGHAWVRGTVSSARLPPPALAAHDVWSQTIKVHIAGMRTNDVIASGFASDPLSVPGKATPGVSDGTWVANRPLGPGASYVVNTYSPHPDAIQLETAGRDYPRYVLDDYRSIRLAEAGVPATAYPQIVFPSFYDRHSAPTQLSGYDTATAPVAVLTRSPYGRVYALARRLAAGARSPYALAVHIERYLLRGYAYNENPPGRADPLVSFLFQDRIGYCQQFSGAMALLLRMAGVPARVSAGFTPGTRSGANGAFVVTDINAHTWVEVWFPGYGWVRFDPTPPIAPALGSHVALPFAKNLPGSGHSAPGSHGLQATGARSPARTHRVPSGGASPIVIALVGAAMALLVWLGVGLRRSVTSAEEQLTELERALARTGRPLAAGVTLTDLEHRFRDSPAAAGYVRALRLARYRGSGGGAIPGARRALRRQLREGLGLSGRVRALWALPPRPARPGTRRPGS